MNVTNPLNAYFATVASQGLSSKGIPLDGEGEFEVTIKTVEMKLCHDTKTNGKYLASIFSYTVDATSDPVKHPIGATRQSFMPIGMMGFAGDKAKEENKAVFFAVSGVDPATVRPAPEDQTKHETVAAIMQASQDPKTATALGLAPNFLEGRKAKVKTKTKANKNNPASPYTNQFWSPAPGQAALIG